jgi:hypothetical protein
MSRTTSAVVVCLLLWLCFAGPASSPTPPRPDRPVLSVVARLARLGLWVMLASERPPTPPPVAYHAHVDSSGDRVLAHGEGW